MTKKACCCGSCPTEDWRCCKPWFRDQFVNIFDKWMDSAAPVSPSDLIVLKINRPESKNGPRIWTWRAGGVCHCGKQCCTPACYAEDLASSPCMACQRNKKCIITPNNDPACVGGDEFAGTAERGQWCGDSVAPCCLPCQTGGGNSSASLLGQTYLSINSLFSKKSSLINKIKNNLFIENIESKRFLTKPSNKFLKNPPSFKNKSNAISLEELLEITTKNHLNKFLNKNLFTKSGLPKDGNDAYDASSLAEPLQNPDDPTSVKIPMGISTSNEVFQYKLKNLYPACLECLEEKGYDIECIRNFNAPKKCQTDKSYKKDFCDECSKECAAFCNPYFGDTWQQRTNLAHIQGSGIFTQNYEYLKGATLLDPAIYLGMKLVNSKIRESMDPLRDTLIETGAEYDLETYQPTEETLSKSPYSFEKYGDYPEISDNVNPDIAFSRDPLISWNARNAGESRIECGNAIGTSCDVCPTGGGMPGSTPLYLIYKFTGCHIKWYPPEYIFNYDPKISQGQGYYHSGPPTWSGNTDCKSFGYLTCDYYLRNNRSTVNETGAEDNGVDVSCYGNSSLEIGMCAKDGSTGNETSFYRCLCKNINLFPCQCYRYPHISGGIHDTVLKRFNMSQKRYQGGYIPKQNPFLPKMKVTAEEAGCMACYNSRDVSNVGQSTCTYYFDGWRAGMANYPKASGKGKSYPAVGAWCNWSKNCLTPTGTFEPIYNPYYEEHCFNRGISPYLSRISKTLYQSAREIFHYGSTVPSSQPVLSVLYSGRGISQGVFGWNSINFKKIYNKKSNLFHKMVGLVGIEYHFECWAYHSSSLFAFQPPVMFNHESALTTPFEAPYAGQWTSNSFTYDPREAFRYWATRHYPRRVIYSSSVVPLFHSDLYAFEKISAYKGLGEFDANKFLEDFYLYFYNLLLEPGDTYWNEPVITVSDVERYNFVSRSIENMIFHNVLSVKDHAQDIADELAELIEYVTAAQNPITQEWYYTFPDDIIEAALGNEIGLKDVILWCANRINEHAQTSIPLPGSNQNLIEYWKTYVKPNFNAKIVKASLVNPQQEMISEFRTEYPIFAGPRRVRLWPTPQSSGLTAWGCEDDNFCENVERRKTYESSLNVKTRVRLEDVGLVEVPFEYESLYSGQEVYFAVTPRGKVRAFGKKPPSPLTEEDIIWGNIGFNRVLEISTDEVEESNIVHKWYYDAIGGFFNGEVYPAEEIGVDAVPYHLSVASEAESAYFIDSPDVSEPLDGRVEKIVNKGKFAVALVSYQDGIVVGANLFEGEPWSIGNKRNFNTGSDLISLYYPSSSVRLPKGDDPPTIQSTCNYVLDNPSIFDNNLFLTHSYKWKQFSNSGWQSPSLCTWPPTTRNYPEGQINLIPYQSSILYPNSTTCSKQSDIGQLYQTLKAWGEPEQTRYGIFYQPNNQEGYWRQPTCFPQQGAFADSTDDYTKRTNIANKYFIWHDVAAGTKHTIAILNDGSLFSTPESSNTYNQSSYGFPTLDGKKHICDTQLFDPSVLAGKFKEFASSSGSFVYSNGIALDNCDDQAQGAPVLWYYNYPKPAYFNDLTEEEWQRLIARNLNNLQNIEILDPSTTDIDKLRKYGYFNQSHCYRRNRLPRPGLPKEDPKNYVPCDIRCHLFAVGNVSADERMNPPASFHRYGLYNYNDYPSSIYTADAAKECLGAYGYDCSIIETDTPVWNKVAAGHYHSMALSTDNNLKIWGSYLKVDSVGNPLPGAEAFSADNPVPVFIPENEIFQDAWALSGLTLGCAWDPNWKDCKNCHPGDAGCLANCYKSEFFNVYTEATKTIFASKAIKDIDGGPDYSILSRKANANESSELNGINGYKLVIWGNKDMVSAVTGKTYTGITAADGKYYYFIEKIVAGPNGIAVLYKNPGAGSLKLDIFERPGVNTGITASQDSLTYTDVALTAGNAAAIYAEGMRANVWKAEDFDDNTHSKIQFKNFGSLPTYFKSQAFFSAVPGSWDFSKWIFGGPCQAIGSDVDSTIINSKDECSIYFYVDNGKNDRFSYSGFPQYYWMRGDWRRNSPVTPTWTYVPGVFQGCGLLRTRGGRDGLKPFNESGSGDILGSYDSPMANANRVLSSVYGSCFGGDVCWIGDGSFTPYGFYRDNPEAGGYSRPAPSCRCWNTACGCPLSCRQPSIITCEPGGGFIGEIKCPFSNAARIGFGGNKDYFVLSTKVFGELVNSRSSYGSGACCGCTNTNITAFFYAKRSNYYKYDSTTGLFKVDCSPYPYRGCQVGFTGSSSELDPPFSTAAPVFEKRFLTDAMVPAGAINKNKFLVENKIPYPAVYVGGKGNYKLEQIINAKFSKEGREKPCPMCKGPGVPVPCIIDEPDCDVNEGLRQCPASPSILVGPGGWLHALRPVSQSRDSSNGEDNSTVYYNEATIPINLLPTAVDALGPLIDIGIYTGPVPEAYRDCRYWAPRPGIVTPPGQEPPCGCPQYPNGYCPNGEQQCEGCFWKMSRGLCGGVLQRGMCGPDCQLFTVRGSTGIDDLGAFYTDEFLPNIPLNVEPLDPELASSEVWNADVDRTTALVKKLFRICDIIPNNYTMCGFTGPAIAFKGNSFEFGGLGAFRGQCNQVGTINTVNIDSQFTGFKYSRGDILTINSNISSSNQAKILIENVDASGRVLALRLYSADDPTHQGYGFGRSTTKNYAVVDPLASGLKVKLTLKAPFSGTPVGYSNPVECDP